MQWYNQTTGINLSLVLITNIFGLLLMIILLVSKGWTAGNKYNETLGKPYKLSAAIGFDIFDFKNEGVFDFLKDIDILMYKNKEEYYRTHDRRSRRSCDRRVENKDTET